MTENQMLALDSDIRSLRELKGSRGWSILMEEIKDDVLNACLQMADNPVMTEKEIDFRRGAISAARNFVNSIDVLISRTENELLLASATKQTPFNLNATA
jgi:hypothetical protein